MINKKKDLRNKETGLFLAVKENYPRIDPKAWIAPTAVVAGDVIIGAESTIWFQAVARGDVGAIRIGEKSNIQDHVVIHCTYQQSHTHIGDLVSVGHGAVLHGCRIEHESLIGMKAVVLDHAVVGSHVIVAAGAVVLEGQQLESGYMYAGVPARKIKPLTEAQRALIARTARNYPMYASWYC